MSHLADGEQGRKQDEAPPGRRIQQSPCHRVLHELHGLCVPFLGSLCSVCEEEVWDSRCDSFEAMHSDDCAISPPGGAGSVSAERISSQEKASGGCECHPVIGTGRGDETIGFEVHHRGGRQYQRGATPTPSSHPETHHVRLSLLDS